MNKFVSIGLSAAVVVVALVIGTRVLGPSAPGDVGSAPSASPSPSPTPAPTATVQPSPSPAAAPPLTQSFTSTVHGITVSYPEGWTAQAATEPWTGRDGFGLVPLDPFADVLSDPLTENLFMVFGSQPIGSSTPDEWVAETMGTGTGYCSVTEPIAVDGATGRIGTGVNACATAVAVTTAGRGYWIRLFTPNTLEGVPFAPYDRAWFERVLATVQLHPEDAVDSTPSPSP